MKELSSNLRHEAVDAGNFGTWLNQIQETFLKRKGIAVPCGACRGCCSSHQFIHVTHDEIHTLAAIPKNLLVKAPGLKDGSMILGYSEKGLCPMLQNGVCSIYEHRPQTCRDYDCRVYAAAGLEAGGPEKESINRRVRAWKFSYSTGGDIDIHGAIKAAAQFIRSHRSSFPDGRALTQPGNISVLSIKVYSVFLRRHGTSYSPADLASAIIAANRDFEKIYGSKQIRKGRRFVSVGVGPR